MPAADVRLEPPTATGAASTRLLVLLCGAHFMDAIDLSDVTVALPDVGTDLAMGPGPLAWVVSAYLLGYGGFLLLGGRAADVLGRRRVFLVSVAVFAVGTLVAALAPSGEVLIASRFAKGVAAGFLAPAALSLITTLWPEGERRGRAIGAYALAGAVGFVGGLVLGGLATEVTWRLAFALPLPIALAVLLLAPRLIPADTAVERREPLDALGALLVTGAFCALVLGLTQAPAWGWTSGATIAAGAGSLLLLTAFLGHEARTAHPLLPLDFLRRRSTVTSSLAIALLWAAYTGFAFLATLGLQRGLGWSPLMTGLAFLPIGIVNGALATRVGRLAGRSGPRWFAVAGAVVLTAGYALFLRFDGSSTFLAVVLPVMLALGLGISLSFAPLNVAALSEVPPERAGLAASLFNTAMQIGGAVGLAAVTSVLAAGTGTGLASSVPALLTVVIASAASAVAAALGRPARAAQPG